MVSHFVSQEKSSCQYPWQYNIQMSYCDQQLNKTPQQTEYILNLTLSHLRSNRTPGLQSWCSTNELLASKLGNATSQYWMLHYWVCWDDNLLLHIPHGWLIVCHITCAVLPFDLSVRRHYLFCLVQCVYCVTELLTCAYLVINTLT